MTRRTVVEREAEALRRNEFRSYEEAMRRVERATLRRIRKALQERFEGDVMGRAMLQEALACCRPERKRR